MLSSLAQYCRSDSRPRRRHEQRVTAVLAGRNELIQTAMATLRRYRRATLAGTPTRPRQLVRLTLNQRHPAKSGSVGAGVRATESALAVAAIGPSGSILKVSCIAVGIIAEPAAAGQLYAPPEAREGRR